MFKSKLTGRARWFGLLLISGLALIALLNRAQPPDRARASAFTPGDLVVVRIGDGMSGLGQAATPVFLDEFQPDGVLVQTLALPTAPNGSNRRLTLSGNVASEGGLTLSPNGRVLALAGYDALPGTAGVARTAVSSTNRVIARVDASGTVDTSTVITDGYNTNPINGAVSNDGTQFWTAGDGTGSDPGGLRYVTFGTSGASTGLSQTPPDGRIPAIFNGQLYLSAASGSNYNINTVGMGLPTTSGQSITTLPGLPTNNGNLYSYVFFDRTGNGTGLNSLYIADASNGLEKFSYDATNSRWITQGVVTSTALIGLTGLTGTIKNGSAILYGTVGNRLLNFTDSRPYDADFSSSTSVNLINPGISNTALRGVAFVPQGVAGTPPAITGQPISQTITYGASATLNVTATGTGTLSYQWYRGGSPTTGTLIPGATDPTYTTPALNATTIYSVRVSNAFGFTDSSVATITVNPNTPPTISQPISLTNAISDPTNPGVNVTLADAETTASALTLTASTTDNPAVAPLSNVTVTPGAGGLRLVKITPAGVGFANLTLTVTDGGGATTTTILHYAASAASVNPATTRFQAGAGGASTAIAVDDNYMLVGDNQDQLLRLYDRHNSGLPINGFDYSTSLSLTNSIDPATGLPYPVDLAASSRSGNRVYWLGSHSNTLTGQLRPNHERLFATDIVPNGVTTTLSYVGRYDNLRTDLINWDHNNLHGKGVDYYGFGAMTAQGQPSVSSDGTGFDLAGLEFAPGSTTTAYLAFRAPLMPSGNRVAALLVPVTNLDQLVTANPTSGRATFGTPIELALGGRSIREIRKNAADQYIILAGPVAGDSPTPPLDFRLYSWTGQAADLPRLRGADLTALRVQGSFEAIVEVPSGLSDNSGLQLLVNNNDTVWYANAQATKDLTETAFKKFRREQIGLSAITTTATGLGLTATPGSTAAGQTASFLATLSPFADSGTIIFTEGENVLGSVPVVNGKAVFNTSNLSVGTHSIAASYSGNNTYAGSTSATLTYVVRPADCDPYRVTAQLDDGTGLQCGTFSYALAQTTGNSSPITVTFALSGTNTVSFSGPLKPAVGLNTIIDGGAGSGIILDGGGLVGTQLRLSGNDTLLNLSVRHFAGPQIVVNGPNNRLNRVRIAP